MEINYSLWGMVQGTKLEGNTFAQGAKGAVAIKGSRLLEKSKSLTPI
jgi:hypothetical protein